MDREITTFLDKGYSTVYYDELTTGYSWGDAFGGTGIEFAHIDYLGIVEGTSRILANYNLTAVESDAVKVKAVSITLTYTPFGGDTDTANFTQLTSFYNTDGVPATVHGAIGSASDYVANVSSATKTSLGTNAVTQADAFLHGGSNAFPLGIMGNSETGDVENAVSANVLWIQYYYPPDEADTWVINEAYPIGYETNKGVGACSSTQDVNIQTGGTLTLNGSTQLTIPNNYSLIIDQGGKLELEVENGAELIKAI